MPNTPRYVTALISSLNLKRPQPDLLRTLGESEWQQLLIFGDHMHLTIPLAQAWGDYCPGWVRSRVEQNIADNTQRFHRIKTVYMEVAGRLREAQIEHLVLKGFTKCPEYAPDPRHRVQADIDLFCPPETIFRARDTLSTIGFRAQHRVDDICEHLPALYRTTEWKWNGNTYDPEMPIAIELHHSFWDHATARCGPETMNDFWRRRVARRLDEISVPALSSIDGFGYLALNLLRDLLRGNGLVTSQVYELACFLHWNSHNDNFWSMWTELHDAELRRLQSVALLLPKTWFECDLHETVETNIDRLPLGTRRWFESPATCPSPMGWLRPNKDRIWLHASLLRTGAEKRKVFFDRLLPRVLPMDAAIAGKVPNSSAAQEPDSFQYSRYLIYLVTRMTYHLRILPTTLWHGFCWWWSART